MATSTRVAMPTVFVLCICFISPRYVAGAAFRGRMAELAAVQGASPELEKALLSEMEEVLGNEHRHATERRLGRIENALRSTFGALPKNEHGRLDHIAVRYAMHRLFVQRHGWFIQGIDPAGDTPNVSAATSILQDRLPAMVQDLFERRVGGRGLTLHELAVMAATLENLIHSEAMDRLDYTYHSLERSKKDPLSVEESHEVVDAYMAIYILGFNYSALSPAEVREQRQTISEVYPTWSETQKFVREVQVSAVPSRDELTYENVASIVEEIGERYGRWQDGECRTLKKDLVAMEDRGTGRVRLADFYRSAVHEGNWQFTESIMYLRELGALDESDPKNPRVIIPNYINSPTNCVASSNYYSVCCIDECDDILGHIEEKLGAAEATPTEITALVAALSSSSMSANRVLPAALLRRLDEVADHHGGRIPLHGRLFAQWLHHAYPRECSYPHISGTTSPQPAEIWMEKTGMDVAASEEEMRRHVEVAHRSYSPTDQTSEEEQYSMWTMHEELKVPSRGAAIRKATGFGTLRGACVVTVIVGLAIVLAQGVNSGVKRRSEDVLPKHRSKYV